MRREGNGPRGKQVFLNERIKKGTLSGVVRENELGVGWGWGKKMPWSVLTKENTSILKIPKYNTEMQCEIDMRKIKNYNF